MFTMLRKADTNDGVHSLTEIDTQIVAMVRAGANRQKEWLVRKCAAKAVPDADASDEDKREAQEARSKQYGIEALETGAALTYPAGSPTTESMYGDPVNLKYPFGKEDNEDDLGRIRNALARFKQAADTYSDTKSKAKVFERIVRKAIAAGVDVGYDPEDPIDQLLPGDLKDRLAKGDEDDETQMDGDGNATTPNADKWGWLDKASETVAELEIDAQIVEALTAQTPSDVTPRQSSSKTQDVGDRSDASSEENERLRQEVEELRKSKLDAERKHRAALAKEKARVERLKKTAVGGSTALVTGEVDTATGDSDDEGLVKKSDRSKWQSGGDLAAR